LTNSLSFNIGTTANTNTVPTSLVIVGQLGGGLGGGKFVDSPVHSPQGVTWPTASAIDSSAGSITITGGGGGYTSLPTVTFTNAAGDTTGSGATAVANVDPATKAVTSITVTSGGSGYTSAPTLPTLRIGQKVTIEGAVVAEPDVRDASVRINVRGTKIVSPVHVPVSTGVLAVLPAHADVQYGEQVRVWGTLEAPQSFDAGSGRQFDYPQYLAAQGIVYELSLAQAEEVQGAPNVGNPLQSAAIWIKETFLHGLAAVLPEPVWAEATMSRP